MAWGCESLRPVAELEMAALPDSSAAIEPRLRVREGMHISKRRLVLPQFEQDQRASIAEPEGVANQRACDRTLIPYLAAPPRAIRCRLGGIRRHPRPGGTLDHRSTKSLSLASVA